jgi:hypothetical protein
MWLYPSRYLQIYVGAYTLMIRNVYNYVFKCIKWMYRTSKKSMCTWWKYVIVKVLMVTISVGSGLHRLGSMLQKSRMPHKMCVCLCAYIRVCVCVCVCMYVCMYCVCVCVCVCVCMYVCMHASYRFMTLLAGAQELFVHPVYRKGHSACYTSKTLDEFWLNLASGLYFKSWWKNVLVHIGPI